MMEFRDALLLLSCIQLYQKQKSHCCVGWHVLTMRSWIYSVIYSVASDYEYNTERVPMDDGINKIEKT
jgi:hypothetical protein